MKSARQRGSGRSSSFRCADPPLPRRGTGFIALGEKIQLVLNNMKAEISGRIRRQRSLSPWPPPESESEQNEPEDSVGRFPPFLLLSDWWIVDGRRLSLIHVNS